MDRRLIAGLLCLSMGGCAHSRSGMPPIGDHSPISEDDALPPIKDVINKIDSPKDVATKPASTLLDIPTEPVSLASRPMKPPERAAEGLAPEVAEPQGRPAPYAKQSGNERIQAPPTSGRPEDQPPAARPAPYAEQAPSQPRAQAPITQSSNSTEKPLPAIRPLLPAIVASADKPPEPEPEPGPISSSPPPVSTRDDKVEATAGKAPSPPVSLARPKSTDPLLGMGGQAAMVGNEVITLDQLRRVLKEYTDKMPPEQKADPQQQKMVVDGVLNKLIERTMLIQAFKKKMKDPKNIQQVYDSVDKGWYEMELPPLLRAEGAANIHELKRKLAEKGKSLDQVREDFRLDTLAHEFLLSNIQNKMHLSLPERQDYYTAHLKEFDRPAQVVWREIAFETVKNASRAEAKRKADSALARLKKGEDFAKMAKTESQGATANVGGKWETSPGSSAVAEINDALAKLPIRAISEVIEVPGGFHILVVEDRREAGPARFDEVQDKIKDILLQKKFLAAADSYLKSLRTKTLISTMFDEKPQGDPSAIRASTDEAPPR